MIITPIEMKTKKKTNTDMKTNTKTNTTIQLSYLLYNIDEVKYSFVLSLLFQSKHSVKECLFWAFEMYKSKHTEYLWNIITQLYYDFYYTKSISFEKTIDKEYLSWKHTNNFQHIAKIVKELHKQPISTIVFENYYTDCCSNLNTVIQNDTELLNQESVDLIESFRYLKAKTVDEIKAIYKKRFRLNSKKEVCLFYLNQTHRWSVKLMSKLIKRKTVWIKTKLTDNDNVFICNLHEPSSSVYKTLKEKRLYEINDCIGAFPLVRFKEETDVVSLWNPSIKKYIYDDVDRVESAYLHNWEYYAKETPFWSELFKKYQVRFKKKEIVFPNNDTLDVFYDTYGFEPDEQNKETQMKSIKPIEKISIETCFKTYHIDLTAQRNADGKGIYSYSV